MDWFGENRSHGMSRNVRGKDNGGVFGGGETWHSSTICILMLEAIEFGGREVGLMFLITS